MSTSSAPTLYPHYEEALQRAIQAMHDRTFYAHYPESPSGKIYGETANDDGIRAFEAQLGRPFAMPQSFDGWLVSSEESPFKNQPLGISYPMKQQAGEYVALAKQAFASWREVDVHARAGILMASLDRVKDRFYELAYATMHSTGQTFVMSFQASGPHANDRAIEAIALGLHEMTRFPQEEVEWVKPMGKFDIRMSKRYRNVPLGVGICVGCSTFPVWNTVPGIYANLITGNTVVVKPHPLSIYPIALVVRAIQEVLAEQGLDPHAVVLAPDTREAQITNELANHPDVKLIDFTGFNAYGDYLESIPGKVVFTEKAGVNSALLHSTIDLGTLANNLAFSVSMYSGQMCTCPQNIFIPQNGIQEGGETVSYGQVVEAITGAIRNIIQHPKMGGGVTGAIQNPATAERVDRARGQGKVLLESESFPYPDFPEARLVSPLVLEVDADQRDRYAAEWFGPIVMIIPVETFEAGLQAAKELAAEKGAISCSAYCTDPDMMDHIEATMAESFTPVSFNFTGMFWVNQNAGFSDFHVTGGNPAGNASLTDPLFVRKRFVMVGSRRFLG